MSWRAGFRAGVRAQLSGLTPAAPARMASAFPSARLRLLQPLIAQLPPHLPAHTRQRRIARPSLRTRERQRARQPGIGMCPQRGERMVHAWQILCSVPGAHEDGPKRSGKKRPEGKPARIGYRETGKRASRARPRGSEYARPCPLRGRAANRPTADASRRKPSPRGAPRNLHDRPLRPRRRTVRRAAVRRRGTGANAAARRRRFTPASRRRARRPPASALRAPASPRQWRRRGRDGDDCRNPTDGSPA